MAEQTAHETATATAAADSSPAAPARARPAAPSLEQIYLQAHALDVPPDLEDEQSYNEAQFQELLAQYEPTLQSLQEGQIVKARVVRVTDRAVILDVGFKSEGAVPLEEFRDPQALRPGDEVEVLLESMEDEQGTVVLSKKKADFLRVWDQIREAHETGAPVPGTILRKVKGGAMVDVLGVEAFLPGSQIALRRVPNIDELVGQTLEFRIIKLNKRRRNIVVSRRVLLEEEREKKREELKRELQVGQVRRGVVKNITDFGVFIDLGGMDGLLHVTDMSWGRLNHPSEMVKIGDEIDVVVLDIDWERERLSLGLKQLTPEPWQNIEERYPVGARVRGKVVSLTNYGAFVELEPGVEGLVHVSEISWTRPIKHPSQVLSIGDEIEAVVLAIDAEQKRISLGIKQTEEDPWLSLPEKYPPGTRIRGKVRNITSFGAFVEVEPGIDGLVHISDMSWTRRVDHPSEILKKGDEVEVVVLSIDPEQKRISLGLKQAQEDPWQVVSDRYPPGTPLRVKITRIDLEGVAVDLPLDEIEAYVPRLELGVAGLQNPADFFQVGDELEAEVLEPDYVHGRLLLRVTRIPKLEEQL